MSDSDIQSKKDAFVQALTQPDSIMVVDVPANIQGYLSHGGDPASLIQMLSSNYEGFAQMANLLQQWLDFAHKSDPTDTGMSATGLVQQHLKQVVQKNFDPERAAKIFEDESGTPDWLSELIEHKEWRQLVYDLSEEHPNSLMLNYLIKLISDAGYQSEIAQISTIANHLDVFSGVLADYLAQCISENEIGLKENIAKVTAIACSSQHTYVYCQVLLHTIMKGPGAPLLRRLSEEIHLACENIGEAAKTEFLFLNSPQGNHVKVAQAVTKILEAQKITHHLRFIYEAYSTDPSDDVPTPTLNLLRFPGFLDLLVDELFLPEQRLRSEVAEQCMYLVAYAVSVDGGDPSPSSEFHRTHHAISEVLRAVQDVEVGSLSASTMGTLLEFVSYPVVARGLLHFLEKSMIRSDFLSDTFTTKILPPHFIILDDIGTRHPLLRDKLLSLLTQTFEYPYSIDSMIAIDLKRKILDRVIYLLALGHALPIISWVHSLCGKTDLSLIVYFLSQMFSSIAPPYSTAFFKAVICILNRSDVQAGFGNKASDRLAVISFLKDFARSSDSATAETDKQDALECVENYIKPPSGNDRH